MEKKLIAIVIFIFLMYSQIHSQGIDFGYGSKEIQGIVKGPIYIIPSGDKIFDDSLKIAVERYWKISSFKFVPANEIDNYLKDENNYFLGLFGRDNLSHTFYVTAPNDVNRYIYILHGGKSSRKMKIDPQDYIECELIFWTQKYAACGLGYVVKNINDNVDLVNSAKLKSPNSLSIRWSADITNAFSKNAKVLKTKTLLIDKNTSYVLKEKILQAYKYSYKIADISEIVSLLSTQPEKYCYLSDHIIYSVDIDIYDGQTKSLVYSSARTGSSKAKVSSKDIMNLNSAIEKE